MVSEVWVPLGLGIEPETACIYPPIPPFPHGFSAFPHDQDRSRHRDRGDVAMVTAILAKVTEVETW